MEFWDYDTRVAAYALIVRDGQVLLTWFNGGPGGSRPGWSLPGGGVEFDESIEEAVVREVYEETGYAVALGQPLATHSFTGDSRRRPGRLFKSVRIIYLADVVGGELGTVEVDGTTDFARWMPFEVASSEEGRADIIDVALDAWRARGGAL